MMIKTTLIMGSNQNVSVEHDFLFKKSSKRNQNPSRYSCPHSEHQNNPFQSKQSKHFHQKKPVHIMCNSVPLVGVW